MTFMSARFGGKCPLCSKRIAEGDLIWYERGQKAVCADCYEDTNGSQDGPVIEVNREWSPLQQAVFTAMVDGDGNIMVIAVAGCLSGRTVINVNRGGKSYNTTIEHLVHMLNGGAAGGKVFNSAIPTRVRSMDRVSNTVKLATVSSGIFSGYKETYLVKTADKRYIRATMDHRFMTPTGWKELRDLTVGDSILVDGGKGGCATKRKPTYAYTSGMDDHPFASQTAKRPGLVYWRVPTHRLVIEAAANGIPTEQFIRNIRDENVSVDAYTFFDPGLKVVHHKDENPRNNALDNLEIFDAEGPDSHAAHHARNGAWTHVQAHIVEDVIVSIGAAEVERTYDLTMEDQDNPNFLANGFVVHNSGKTTTIVEGMKRYVVARPSHAVISVAFNKRNADELGKRLQGTGVVSSTFHSAWNRALTESLGHRPIIDSNKVRKIARDAEKRNPALKPYSNGAVKLVAAAKSAGIGIGGLLQDTEENWSKLITRFDVQFDGDSESSGIKLASILLAASNENTSVIDYDDMLYLSAKLNAVITPYDLVVIDEAQDFNGVQRLLLHRMLTLGTGRLVAVGDPYQSIYGFRGADFDSMDRIKEEFACAELPLDISYRCPQAVVAEARKIVPHIQASPTAPMGSVEYADVFDVRWMLSTDGWICRNIAPVVALAYRCLKARVSVRVLGREIGSGLISLIEKMKAADLKELQEKLENYRMVEVQRLTATMQDSKAEALNDKIDSIEAAIAGMIGERTIETLIAEIGSVFAEKPEGITTLCTIHKAKGAEWPRVFILDPWRMPSKRAKTAEAQQQERNIQYVAITRAQETLVYIDSKVIS